MLALLDAVAEKKNRLDRLRPLPPDALSKLEHYYDVDITYTSNAIEGNSLSPAETTLVIEQGVTIGGLSGPARSSCPSPSSPSTDE
jgi:Fic family protein